MSCLFCSRFDLHQAPMDAPTAHRLCCHHREKRQKGSKRELLGCKGGVMRTRRSPRNQDRLWCELGGKKKPKKVKRTPLPSRAEVREARQKEFEEMRDRFNHGMMTKEEEAEALESLDD